MHIYIYIYKYVSIYISALSSPCCAASTDFPDSLSPLVSRPLYPAVPPGYILYRHRPVVDRV